MPHAADFFRAFPVSGKSVALLASVSVHAVVALAAARGAPHGPRNGSLASAPALLIADLELTLTEPPAREIPTPDPARSAARANHHHEYAVPPDHDAAVHDPSIRHLPLAGPSPSPAPAPAVIDSPSSPTAPRFAITLGATSRGPLGSELEHGPTAAAGSAAAGSAPSSAPAAENSVDTPAKLLAGAAPSYTPEAQAAGIEADVPLEIVVDDTGSVIAAHALSHVGYGLDHAALLSVRGYRFAPARRAGKALAVRMRWLMRFQLR